VTTDRGGDWPPPTVIAGPPAADLGSEPSDDAAPHALDAFVGGAMGDSFHVTWNGTTLTHQHLGQLYTAGPTTDIRPSSEDWAAFRGALDDIGVWEWAESYCDLGVMDGTNWTFAVRFSDRRVESKGSNAHPPRFAEWLRAVSALSGGAAFR
jgi:hypothetical protein